MTEEELSRSRQLEVLRQHLSNRLTNVRAAIEMLLDELELGETRREEWDALHVAAARDGIEVELGTAYQEVLTRQRLYDFDPRRQVHVLMHAADFFQGILGDAELARRFLVRVLEVTPDHAEAFDRLERARRSMDDRRGLLDLYALVARNPPVPRDHLAVRATHIIEGLPDWLGLSEQTCLQLLPLVPANPQLLDGLVAHCRQTGRGHLAKALAQRASYTERWTGDVSPRPSFRAPHRSQRPPPLSIHGFSESPYTRTVRLACLEKAVPHEIVELKGDPGSLPSHPFLELPPAPHAAAHDAAPSSKTTLSGALAICIYIDMAYPGPPLQPAAPLDRARMFQWVSAAIRHLHDDLVPPPHRHPKDPDALRRLSAALNSIESELTRRDYLSGSELSLADLFVGPLVDRVTRTSTTLASRTKGWLDALCRRASFRSTA